MTRSPRFAARCARVGLVVAAVFVAGCSGPNRFLADVQDDYAAGRFASANDRLQELEDKKPFNRHVYALNRGVTELALARPEAAVSAMRQARDRMDELASEDYGSWFSATLESDTQLAYPGEDYEQVLVRAMLSIADLMAGGGDADAFANQVLERQQEIIDAFQDDDGTQPKKAYKLVGFGAYLRAILHEDRPLEVDVAEREYRKLADLEPAYPFAAEDIERVSNGRHAGEGNGVIHVIALLGRAPYKVEVPEQVSTEAMQIAQVVLAVIRNQFTIPNLQSVKIPALEYHTNNPARVFVDVNGKPSAETVVVTDVEDVATQQFDVLHDWIVARAVLRRVFKLGVTEGAKALVGHAKPEEQLIGLGIDVIGNIWTAQERADLRCWALLPATFQAARIEVPEGVHTVTLRAASADRPDGKACSVDVRVRRGTNTYVVWQAPTVSAGSTPLTSDPADGRVMPPDA